MSQPTNDRRRFRRVKAPVFVRPVGPMTGGLSRQVNDISLGGLRAYTDETYRDGQKLELELFFPDGTSATVVAQVVWIQPLPKGSPARYDVGLAYVSVADRDRMRIAQVLGDE